MLRKSIRKRWFDQPSATSPPFFDNLHFEHFDKSVNLDSWLTFLPTQTKKWWFRSTFQGREYSIWAMSHWKVLRTSAFHLLFLLPKSSFGEHDFCRNVQNGDCRKKGDYLPTAGLGSMDFHNFLWGSVRTSEIVVWGVPLRFTRKCHPSDLPLATNLIDVDVSLIDCATLKD